MRHFPEPLLFRGAAQVLTLRGTALPRRGAALADVGLVEHGAILTQGDRIVAAGPARAVEKAPEARQAREIVVRGRVVMPGFVDSHTHLIHGRARLKDYEMRLTGSGYAEISAAGGGILSSVAAVRVMSPSALKEQAGTMLHRMARHGTTTVEAKSGYGLDERAEWNTLRALTGFPEVIPTYLGPHVVPPEYRKRGDQYIHWICDSMLPRLRKRKLAQFADVYCDAGAFTLAQARRYLETARVHGYGLKVHAEQFSRTGGALLAVELGAVSADHLEQAGKEEIRALGSSETIATLLPGAVFHLGLSRYAPARALIEAGAAVALGTDFNPGTSPTFSMPMVMSLACTMMRMTPAEAISAATINGACALACGDRVGSLEPGKQADLAVFDVSDYREIPYYFGTNTIFLTLKRGEIVPCREP